MSEVQRWTIWVCPDCGYCPRPGEDKTCPARKDRHAPTPGRYLRSGHDIQDGTLRPVEVIPVELVRDLVEATDLRRLNALKLELPGAVWNDAIKPIVSARLRLKPLLSNDRGESG